MPDTRDTMDSLIQTGMLAASPGQRDVTDLPPPSPPCLSEEQLGSFHSRGYLALKSISNNSEISGLIPLYDRMFQDRSGYQEGNYFDFAGPNDAQPVLPQILMPSLYQPALHATQIFRNCEILARQLLGPKATFVFDHAMLKPADGGAATPWHQDQAFYDRGSRMAVTTFWVPLQDVDCDSGCLRFVPHSSHGPLYEHRPILGDPRVHGLEALASSGQPLDMDRSQIAEVPLEAGGVVVFHRLTLHGASRNISKMPRRAYAMGFGVMLDHPLTTKDYPWNIAQNTARKHRWWSSLSPAAQAKQWLKRGYGKGASPKIPGLR